jgi:acyl-coenzyme A synthetase/AMP-(fatty) acid ligase
MMPEKAITFGMLLGGICSVQATLAKLPLDDTKPIGILIEDPVRHIILSLALMKAGFCTVALRPDCLNTASRLGLSEIISATPIKLPGVEIFLMTDAWFQVRLSVHDVSTKAVDGDRITRVEFTSGSTGTPKPIGVTANNLYNQTANRIVAYSLISKNLMSMFKLTSNIGFGLALAQLSLGRTISFSDANDSAIDMINYHGIGTLAGSPDQIRRLCSRSEETGKGFGSLVKTILAGSIVTGSEIFELQLILGSLIQIDYGSTETGPVATYLSGSFKRNDAQDLHFIAHQDVDFIPDSQDPSLTHKEIRLRSTGMGWPFGGTVTQTETDRADGWFYPRDLAEKMPDGSFTLVGRSDFLLNFGGVKFSPERLEADLVKRFGLEEVAVVPGGDGGEAVTVLNIAHSTARGVTLPELKTWALAVHPTIRIGSIRAFPELPRTTSNKLDRQKLQSLF